MSLKEHQMLNRDEALACTRKTTEPMTVFARTPKMIGEGFGLYEGADGAPISPAEMVTWYESAHTDYTVSRISVHFE